MELRKRFFYCLFGVLVFCASCQGRFKYRTPHDCTPPGRGFVCLLPYRTWSYDPENDICKYVEYECAPTRNKFNTKAECLLMCSKRFGLRKIIRDVIHLEELEERKGDN